MHCLLEVKDRLWPAQADMDRAVGRLSSFAGDVPMSIQWVFYDQDSYQP